jgi:hypothetical protein
MEIEDRKKKSTEKVILYKQSVPELQLKLDLQTDLFLLVL